MSVVKSAVAANFSAAAATYEDNAAVQIPAARHLASILPPGFSPRTVLDIGCGTGVLTRELTRRFPAARLAGMDLAPAMVGACRAAWPYPHVFLCGDAEDFDAEGNAFDLVASSFAMQWFADKPGTIVRFAAALAPGGIFALATPVHGTLFELAAAHAVALKRPLQALSYPPEEAYAAWAAAAGLSVIHEEAQDIAIPYPDAFAVLKSFKGIGATFKGASKPLSPREVHRLTAAYERDFRSDAGVPATYRVLTLIAHR
ncbi:methyltransferase domain-containing protein [Oleispirillum naphthae]|uniref:methyltransferase domain-containing protein n=1 Tax=Oleispirillum naphthae TaxID=2838853 RepID=UPI003082533D